MQARATKLFKEIDDNGNGIIDAAELKLALSNLGIHINQAQLNLMMYEADIDGDHGIDLQVGSIMLWAALAVFGLACGVADGSHLRLTLCVVSLVRRSSWMWYWGLISPTRNSPEPLISRLEAASCLLTGDSLNSFTSIRKE